MWQRRQKRSRPKGQAADEEAVRMAEAPDVTQELDVEREPEEAEALGEAGEVVEVEAVEAQGVAVEVVPVPAGERRQATDRSGDRLALRGSAGWPDSPRRLGWCRLDSEAQSRRCRACAECSERRRQAWQSA